MWVRVPYDPLDGSARFGYNSTATGLYSPSGSIPDSSVIFLLYNDSMNIFIHELTFSIPEMIKGDRFYDPTKSYYAPIMYIDGTKNSIVIPCFCIYPDGEAVPTRKEYEGGAVENPTIKQLWKQFSNCISAVVNNGQYDCKSDINLYLFRQSENKCAVGILSSYDGTTYRRLLPSELEEEKKRWKGQE